MFYILERTLALVIQAALAIIIGCIAYVWVKSVKGDSWSLQNVWTSIHFWAQLKEKRPPTRAFSFSFRKNFMLYNETTRKEKSMSDDTTSGSIALEIGYVVVTGLVIAVTVVGVKRVTKKVKALRAAKSQLEERAYMGFLFVSFCVIFQPRKKNRSYNRGEIHNLRILEI